MDNLEQLNCVKTFCSGFDLPRVSLDLLVTTVGKPSLSLPEGTLPRSTIN